MLSEDNADVEEEEELRLKHFWGIRLQRIMKKVTYIDYSLKLLFQSHELLAEAASDRNFILKSMNLMKLKKRECGSGVSKFNTLNGRWFGKTGECLCTLKMIRIKVLQIWVQS